MLNNTYWNQRYLKNEIGWNIGEASIPLITYINQLHYSNLSILVPGAGNAYEATYCYNKGFENVFVLDWSEIAINNFKKNTPTFPTNKTFCEDFFNHQGQYDLILEQTFFCAIDPNLRVKYVEKMHQLLKPKGKLVGLLFNKEFEKEGPPFGAVKTTYETLFKPFFNLIVLETCFNSITPRKGTELFFIFEKR